MNNLDRKRKKMSSFHSFTFVNWSRICLQKTYYGIYKIYINRNKNYCKNINKITFHVGHPTWKYHSSNGPEFCLLLPTEIWRGSSVTRNFICIIERHRPEKHFRHYQLLLQSKLLASNCFESVHFQHVCSMFAHSVYCESWRHIASYQLLFQRCQHQLVWSFSRKPGQNKEKEGINLILIITFSLHDYHLLNILLQFLVKAILGVGWLQ